MAERRQDLTDEGPLHRYRTEIPNTVVRGLKSQGLSVHAKWLYVYFKSVCGDTCECYRTTTTIAAESGLSRAMVSTCKKELAAQGLIVVQKSKLPNRHADHIHIKDIWLANMQEFSVPLANAGHTSISDENSHEDGSSVLLANADDDQRSISECSVLLANSSVLLANQRRSQEEDPLKKENPSPIVPSGDVGEGFGNTGTEGHTMAPSKPAKKKARLATDYTPGFNKWWASYPVDRRADKPKCFEVWEAEGLEARTEELVAKIERLKRTTWNRKKDERHFIKTSLPYLNGGRFEDELVPMDYDKPTATNKENNHGVFTA